MTMNESKIHFNPVRFRLSQDKEMEYVTQIKDALCIIEQDAKMLSRTWEGDAKNNWMMRLEEDISGVDEVTKRFMDLMARVNAMGVELGLTMDKVELLTNSVLV